MQLDLEDYASIQSAIGHLISKEGRIDALINNAGVGIAGAIEDCSPEDVEKVFRTNVFGVMECCRAAIPSMRAQGGGWIVNISSIAGEFGLPFRGVYCASKSALDLFSETLRMELKPANIRVSIVQPGDVRTNINSNRLLGARSTSEDSPHYHHFKKIYNEISDDVATAKDPEMVARIIWKILQLDKPRMRYPAASFIQRLSLSLNRVLPKHIFQGMLMRKYPVE